MDSGSPMKEEIAKAASPARAKFRPSQGTIKIEKVKTPKKGTYERTSTIECINTAAGVQMIVISKYEGQDAFTNDLVVDIEADISEIRDRTGINFSCSRRVSKAEDKLLRNVTATVNKNTGKKEYYPRRGFFRMLPVEEEANPQLTAGVLLDLMTYMNAAEVKRRDMRVAAAQAKGEEVTEETSAIWDTFTVPEVWDISPPVLLPLDNYMMDLDLVNYMKHVLVDASKWNNWAAVNNEVCDCWFSPPYPWIAMTNFGYRPRDGF